MEIKERLEKVFQISFDDSSISIHDEMTAADIEEWDSLNHMLLIVAVEKEFGVKFAISEIVDLKNVGEMVGLLKSKTGQA
ncbi:MAG: acyl carrier protein [Bdellovibrionales bacterium]